MRTLHSGAFKLSVAWTLLLLFLGSVVHATGSSLACPDWPTCFGTMMPEMKGGVFWEHLHRLVAGGLVLLWGLATWLAYRETYRERRWVFRAALVGIGLLLIQSLFGGLTVIFRLPDLISTTHLGLALLFLSLATVLASATSRYEAGAPTPDASRARAGAGLVAGLVFVQSVLGGLVRHMDAGMACPDVPLCLGKLVPPLENRLIAIHFLHRALGAAVTLAVIGLAWWAARAEVPPPIRSWSVWAGVLALIQLTLGVVSVLTGLAVVPVSLHTLIAASLLATLVHIAFVASSAVPARQSPRTSAASPV
jgi:heme A synthase